MTPTFRRERMFLEQVSYRPPEVCWRVSTQRSIRASSNYLEELLLISESTIHKCRRRVLRDA